MIRTKCLYSVTPYIDFKQDQNKYVGIQNTKIYGNNLFKECLRRIKVSGLFKTRSVIWECAFLSDVLQTFLETQLE